MSRPFRFGVDLSVPAPAGAWRAKCRRAEELGYDVLLVPDQLGMVALVAAAQATERPRLRTSVLDAGFWNPALPAREVATADALTGGRLELGIGAGYVRAEHDAAGLPFGSPGERVDHVRHMVREPKRLLESADHQPRPARHRVPLLIGADGPRMLQLAAEHADIAAFTGARAVPGSTTGQLVPRTAEELDASVAGCRARTVDAAATELNLLIRTVLVTEDREARRPPVRPFAEYVPQLATAQVLEPPTLPAGTVEEIAGQVRAPRARYGFSYLTVPEPYMEDFAPVVRALRGEWPPPSTYRKTLVTRLRG